MKTIEYHGITVTSTTQALTLLHENQPQDHVISVPRYEYGQIVGFMPHTIKRSSQEQAQKRVAAKRWLRANGYANLIAIMKGL